MFSFTRRGAGGFYGNVLNRDVMRVPDKCCDLPRCEISVHDKADSCLPNYVRTCHTNPLRHLRAFILEIHRYTYSSPSHATARCTFRCPHLCWHGYLALLSFGTFSAVSHRSEPTSTTTIKSHMCDISGFTTPPNEKMGHTLIANRFKVQPLDCLKSIFVSYCVVCKHRVFPRSINRSWCSRIVRRKN